MATVRSYGEHIMSLSPFLLEKENQDEKYRQAGGGRRA